VKCGPFGLIFGGPQEKVGGYMFPYIWSSEITPNK